jgi:hypothetical protein
MSYRIVRQTINGQRRTTVANGIMDYDAALDRAGELESRMFDNEDCEMRGFTPQETFIVEEE